MAVYRGKNGMVGIYLGTMPAYGIDPGGASHQIWCNVADSGQSATQATDAGMANGFEEETVAVTVQENSSFALSGNVSDIAFPAFVGLALGTDDRTTTGSAYRLNQYPSSLSAELPNTSIQTNPGSVGDSSSPLALCHLGVVVDSLTISGSTGSPWQFSGAFKTSGNYGSGVNLASGLTTPGLVVYPFEKSYLFAGADGTMTPTTVENTNGTPVGTCLSAPENWGASLQSFSWTINNNLDEGIGHTANGQLYATSMPRGDRTQSLAMTFKWPSNLSTIQALRKNIGYISAFQLRCQTNSQIGSTGYYYGFELKFPRARLTGATIGGGLGVKTIDTTWSVMNPTATYNSVYGHSWSGQLASTPGGLIN